MKPNKNGQNIWAKSRNPNTIAVALIKKDEKHSTQNNRVISPFILRL